MRKRKAELSAFVKVEEALGRLKSQVGRDGGPNEIEYLQHEPRYRRNIQRILELVPPGSMILDVGSHFLHQATVLAELGYQVVGVDVPEFVCSNVVEARACEYGIRNVVEGRLDRGLFLSGQENTFDLVVFSEVQEHITFNPVLFWRRIYDLLKVGGVVYMTTPNGLATWKMVSIVKNLLLMRGWGPTIPEILRTVTYGHHWKEYSRYELRLLFEMLSPDFSVSIHSFQQQRYEAWRSPKAILRDVVRRCSSSIPALREELEVVVTLNARTAWTGENPSYD